MQSHWRDEFIAATARAGLRLDTARKLLSLTATAHRLAEASCNGDWPADNGARPTIACPECSSNWATGTVTRKGCPDCRNEARIRALVTAECPGWTVRTAGDPRGCVVTLCAPDGREIGVPA